MTSLNLTQKALVQDKATERTFRQMEIWARQTEAKLGLSYTNQGAYTDVPIGGLLSFTTGPSVNTNYSASTTIFTQAVNLVGGNQYQVTIGCFAQQITNAATNATVFVTDSSALIVGGNGHTLRAFDGNLAVSEAASSCNSTIISPTVNVTDTFTVTALSTVVNLTVFANSAQLTITRVA